MEGRGSHKDRVVLPAIELGQALGDGPAQGQERGPREALPRPRLAPRRAHANAQTPGREVDPGAGHHAVARVLPPGEPEPIEPGAQPLGGEVLGRVDGEVEGAREQRVVQVAREEVAGGGAQVGDLIAVARGREGDELEVEPGTLAQVLEGPFGLNEAQGAIARANAERGGSAAAAPLGVLWAMRGSNLASGQRTADSGQPRSATGGVGEVCHQASVSLSVYPDQPLPITNT